MKIRLMSPSLMERLFGLVRGPEGPLFFYVEGEIPQPLSMKLKGLGATPVGISRSSLRLGDLRVRVPPWFFTLHDLFHAAMITKFSLPLREVIGRIYFLALGDSRLRRSPFLKEHLVRLSDMDPPLENRQAISVFFGHTLRHLSLRYAEDKRTDRLDLRRILQYRNFLKNYVDLLKAHPPVESVERDWQSELSAELETMLGKFERMIREVTQAYVNFLKQK